MTAPGAMKSQPPEDEHIIEERASIERALNELQGVPRVKKVILTDTMGNVLHAAPSSGEHQTDAEWVDLLMGAAARSGSELALGEVGVLANLCDSGMLIVARSPSAHVAVLAESKANLGSLLNHVRRIFPGEEAP